MVGPSTADATSIPTIKLVCSYGGKILPRHTDGKLRYHGGHTRVLAVQRSIPFSELLLKLGELCGTPVNVRCRLPTEDLDALVSVTCDEDLANIIEEYDRLAAPSCQIKLRAFLFPPKPLRKPTASSTSTISPASPRLVSSASSKSSSSSTSSSSSSHTLSAASAAAVASSSPRYAMMRVAVDGCFRQKLSPQLSWPMGVEKSKGKIAHHCPAPHPEYHYNNGRRPVNYAQHFRVHHGNNWQ